MSDPRPACLITSRVTDYRREPFGLLAAEQDVEILAFDQAGAPVDGLPLRSTSQAGAARVVASGAYRAVICGLGGRLALPGSYAGARRAGIPFVLWASLWAHPRTLAHALSYLPMRYIYARADAVVTYGPHVSAYVAARRRRRGNVFEAPQAVSAEQFAAEPPPDAQREARQRAGASEGDLLVLFVGRLVREKGVAILIEAWRRAELGSQAVLAVAGEGPLASLVASAGERVRRLGFVPRGELPALYAAADVLVLPSIRTATFTEPWGLVVNEAMHQGTPIIASDAVGAVAGGLVRNDRNGLVVPAGDAEALAARLRSISKDSALRDRLAAAALNDIEVFTPAAWVKGMGQALASVGASRTAKEGFEREPPNRGSR